MSGTHWRDHASTTLIAIVSAFFGVALVQGTTLVSELTSGDGAAAAIMAVVSWVFIGLGAYTAAVVTANTFATIVAGRVRLIAQHRLLGATARRLRAGLALEGLAAGLIGAAIGWAAALGAFALLVEAGIASGELPPLAYTLVSPWSVAPALVALLTVWIAAHHGSRAVGRVTPIQALASHLESPVDERRPGVARVAVVTALIALGLVLLGGGAVLGAVSPLGVLIAFVGGVLSFTGIVLGAELIVPRLLALMGRALGRGVPAVLARENALRSPRAASRGAIGMIIGVTLIVMFVVAVTTLRTVVDAQLEVEVAAGHITSQMREGYHAMLDIVLLVTIGLTAVSAVLAAIGMVANLAQSVLQRRRELGLLRAVGATGRQVRTMILIESLLTSAVAILTGSVLGVFYGWIGAQSALGFSVGGFAALAVPWQLPLIVVGAVLVLAGTASIAPALRATRITPIEALRVA